MSALLCVAMVALAGCGEEVSPTVEGSAPVVSRLELLPVAVEPGRVATVSAGAIDPDGDALTYRWEADAGTFADPTAAETTWQAPSVPGQVILTFHAFDGTYDTALRVSVTVLPPPAGDPDSDGALEDDCGPTDPATYPGADEVPDNQDNDCDDLIDEGTDAVDDDRDGFSEWEGDCADNDAEIRPGVDDPIDGFDNDCDGLVDEGSNTADDDGDGLSEARGDCDDTRPDVFPGALEAPDGADNDCDGQVDDGTTLSDDDGDGYSDQEGDCDDTSASIYPGAAEQANGRDEDCDLRIDEDTAASDDDGDGYAELEGDCDDQAAAVKPGAAEVFNGRDDDCDAQVDEGTEAYDDDDDGHSELEGDCDDRAAKSYPGAVELADGADNDCDGWVDEETDRSDDDGDGHAEVTSSGAPDDCDDQNRYIRPGLPDSADGLDNDCDGTRDEDTALADDDGDGFAEVTGDCDDDDPAIFPGSIDPPDDGVDQDCLETAVVLPPEPRAAESGAATGCTPRTFTAAGTVDPAGRPLWYDWFVVYAPTGSTAFSAAGSSLTFALAPDRDGVYQVGLAAGNDVMTGAAVFVTFDVSGCAR